MSLISTPWDIFVSFLIFFVGLAFVKVLSKSFRVKVGRAIFLYFWHAFFSIIYSLYVVSNGGDAVMYYETSLAGGAFRFGTDGIRYLTGFFTILLGASFLGASLGYHIFGFIGLLAFDGAVRQVTFNKSKIIRQIATFIVFLPSISFWSSSIGKDALSFMAMGLALWAALNLKRRLFLMAFAVLIMLFVRPHMAGMMVIGLTVSMVLQSGVSGLQRLGFGIASLAGVAVLVPLALNYAGVGADAGVGELASYIEGRQAQNLDGGSSVDIANMSLPMQLFTYLFRPLPIEANSLSALAASLDNVILLFLFIAGGWALLRRIKSPEFSGHNRIFLWVYSLLAWAVLAMTSANLGIAMRQKWMFAPMLIFLLISVIGKPRRVTASGTSHPVACSAPVKHGPVTKI